MSICSFFTLRLFTLSWRKRTWAVRILYAALSALFGVLDPKRNPGTGERVYLNGTIITYILSKTLRGVLRRDDVGRASGRTFSGKLPNVATCARSVGFYGFAIVACPKKPINRIIAETTSFRFIVRSATMTTRRMPRTWRRWYIE